MRVYAGTSGYSYKEWRGDFYPDDLSSKDMLRFYADQLSAVEINNTFYRLPRRSVLETWASEVPEGFRFAIKASRRITHFKRLEDAQDETEYLLSTLAGLDDRLGCLLFQLPPNLKLDLERLQAFLELLPEGTRAAFEFRNRSWEVDAVTDCLRERGVALCHADSEDAPADELVATADWGYLRLRREDYGETELAEWAARLADTAWQEAFVFFKHEDGCAGPRLAARFAELATAS